MNSASVANVFVLTPADGRRLASLCGQFNSNIKSIENHFNIRVSNRGNLFQIDGDKKTAIEVERLLRNLYAETESVEQIEPSVIHDAISRLNHAAKEFRDPFTLKIRKNIVSARNLNQQRYLRSIENNDVCISVGPAGTGKTYLAVASAAHALANDHVRRIVLVRPVVEAGERLGFLPGDIGQKVNPYLRPLYDALYEMLGFDRVGRLLERGVIELAPLAFMRGRTLNEAFVILDEGQNTTREQMKMFLTRIGFGSKVVITGDITQIDLPNKQQSGMVHALRILDGIEGLGIIRFNRRDIVRHALVQSIVAAYEQDAGSSD